MLIGPLGTISSRLKQNAYSFIRDTFENIVHNMVGMLSPPQCDKNYYTRTQAPICIPIETSIDLMIPAVYQIN